MKSKNLWRKAACGLFAAAILITGLAGCGSGNVPQSGTNGTEALDTVSGNSETSGGKGRYIETEQTLPEGVSQIYDMAYLENKTVELFARNDTKKSYAIYTSTDAGQNWKETLCQVPDGYVSAASIAPDGTVCVVLISYRESENGISSVEIVGKDGSTQEKELIFPETSGGDAAKYEKVLVGCAFDSQRNFFVQNLSGNILKADLTTGKCDLFCDILAKGNSARYFDVALNTILVVTAQGVLLFDSTNGSELETDDILNEMIAQDSSLVEKISDFGTSLVFASGLDSEDMFYVNHAGIYHHNRGGSVSEQLVNGALTSMGDTSVTFHKLIMVDEEHFLLSILDAAGKCKLLAYTYDETISATPETELKVYALEDSVLLRQTISSYQRKYPDDFVNLQIGLSNGMTVEDALRALNTDILAGKGPDVLILDGMPVDSYIEKGILADIGPVVKELEKSDGLFENIVSAFTKEGAVYEIPARVYFNIFVGNEEACKAATTLEGMTDYIKSQPQDGEDIIPIRSAGNLLEELYHTASAGFVGETGKVDETALLSYLEQSKTIYDTKQGVQLTDEQLNYALGNTGVPLSSANAFGILMKENKNGFGTLTDMNNLTMLLAVNKKADTDYELACPDTAKSFIPQLLTGINSNTTKMTEAENFLRETLGAECGSVDGSGFPINRKAYESLCEMAENQYNAEHVGGISVSSDEGIRMDVTLDNPTREEIKKLTGILESLEQPVSMDRVVKEIILEQGKAYLQGNQTAKEAVTAIVQKCNLYLSE